MLHHDIYLHYLMIEQVMQPALTFVCFALPPCGHSFASYTFIPVNVTLPVFKRDLSHAEALLPSLVAAIRGCSAAFFFFFFCFPASFYALQITCKAAHNSNAFARHLVAHGLGRMKCSY